MMGEALASAPPLPCPPSPPHKAAEVQPAQDASTGELAPDGAAPQAPGSSDPRPHMPPPVRGSKIRAISQTHVPFHVFFLHGPSNQ